MITQKQLKELLDYDPETGLFTWLERSLDKFKSEKIGIRWNTKFSGKITGCLHSSGYKIITINNHPYRSHRLAWLYVYGEIPETIDHINHDRTDNRIINLRNTCSIGNARNSKLRENNKSGVMGVVWVEKQNKWRVLIYDNRKQIHLGYFADFLSAVCKRKSEELNFNYHENHGKKESL